MKKAIYIGIMVGAVMLLVLPYIFPRVNTWWSVKAFSYIPYYNTGLAKRLHEMARDNYKPKIIPPNMYPIVENKNELLKLVIFAGSMMSYISERRVLDPDEQKLRNSIKYSYDVLRYAVDK